MDQVAQYGSDRADSFCPVIHESLGVVGHLGCHTFEKTFFKLSDKSVISIINIVSRLSGQYSGQRASIGGGAPYWGFLLKFLFFSDAGGACMAQDIAGSGYCATASL